MEGFPKGHFYETPCIQGTGYPRKNAKNDYLVWHKNYVGHPVSYFSLYLIIYCFYFQTPDLLSNDVKSQSYSTKTKTSVSSNGIKKSFGTLLSETFSINNFLVTPFIKITLDFGLKFQSYDVSSNGVSSARITDSLRLTWTKRLLFFWKQPIYGLLSILENK